MAQAPARLRRTPLALATAFVVVAGTLALGMAGASATGTSAIRKYSPTLTANTSCVAPGSVNRFTATITNSSTSNQPLGSALFHSNTANGFRNILFRSFTKPVATGGKTWQALPDLLDADGIYLRAASPSQALSPGQSVTVTFQGKAPSSTGLKTWATLAWQGNSFLGGSFSLASGASHPVVTVDTSCPATFPNGGTVTTDTPGTQLEVVPNNVIDCDTAYDGPFPGFAGTVQITPPAESGDVLVTFDDPNGADHEGAPVCKGMSEGPPVILTFPEDSCENMDGQPPCIDDQYLTEGGHLITTLLIDPFDPPVRH
jgi:hypothetical protein